MMNREDLWIVGLVGCLVVAAGARVHADAMELDRMRAENREAGQWVMEQRMRQRDRSKDRVALHYSSSSADVRRLEVLDWRDQLRYPEWDWSRSEPTVEPTADANAGKNEPLVLRCWL